MTASFTKIDNIVTTVTDTDNFSEFQESYSVGIDESNNLFLSCVTDVDRKTFALVSMQDTSFGGVTPSTRQELQDFINEYFYKQVSDAAPSVQLQSDWNQVNSEFADFIKNKPAIPASQVQSDWNQTNNTLADFIKNKPAPGGATAGNGAHIDGASGKVYLGGTLLEDTQITGALFQLLVQGSHALAQMRVNNSGNGACMRLSGTGGGSGLNIDVAGNLGLSITSSNANCTGISSSTIGTNNVPISATKINAVGNASTDIIRLTRNTSGTPDIGLGAAIDFSLQTTAGFGNSNKIISRWVNATTGANISALAIQGVNNAGVPLDVLIIKGNGDLSLPLIRTFANDAAADADATLESKSFYKITGNRAVFQKP